MEKEKQREKETNTYDVVFHSDTDSNSKGFKMKLVDALTWVAMHNGTNHSYFADYKGGTVQVVCNETEEVVYSEEVR